MRLRPSRGSSAMRSSSDRLVGQLEDFLVAPERVASSPASTSFSCKVGVLRRRPSRRGRCRSAPLARAKLTTSSVVTLGVDGDAGRAGLEDAEVADAPLGRVVADEQDAVAGLDARAGEEGCGARRQLAAGRRRCTARCSPSRSMRMATRVREALGRGLEELEQVAVGVDALGLRAHVLFERREDPLLEAGEVDVHPVVVPVERLRVPAQEPLLVLAHLREERAHVVGAEDVGVLDHERAEHVERLFGLARHLLDTLDGCLRAVNDVGEASAAPARAHAVEQRRDLLRRGVDHRRRRRVEARGRDRLASPSAPPAR